MNITYTCIPYDPERSAIFIEQNIISGHLPDMPSTSVAETVMLCSFLLREAVLSQPYLSNKGQ